jgi:hypothetical protein
MYIPNWQAPSDPDADSKFLSDAPNTDAARMDPADRRLRHAPLPFYARHSLVGVKDTSLPEPNELFYLWAPGTPAVLLDWSNIPIYETNEADGMRLFGSALKEYLLFFFHFVRGQLGHFAIVETADQIHWQPDAEARKAGLAQLEKDGAVIEPLRYAGVGEQHDLHILRAETVFKNALFRTDILLAPYRTTMTDPDTGEVETFSIGQCKLTGEELLSEGLPVVIDGPPDKFGRTEPEAAPVES